MLLDQCFFSGSDRSARRYPLAVLGLLLASAALLSACGKSEAQKGREAEQAAKDAAYREKYAKAKALFEERCKTAGVVVKRVVKDVEGIELTKIRQPIPFGGKEYFDPMWPEAAMAGEHRGDDYIKQFLMSEFLDDRLPGQRGVFGPPTTGDVDAHSIRIPGYQFIEYVDPQDRSRKRCVPDWSRNHPNWVPGQHHCEKVSTSRARYALDYEDLVDPADRAQWIAGTKVKVIDTLTGEVIGELTRFVWDTGFGVSATGRWPWQYAGTSASTTCPSDATRRTGSETRYFVDRVLEPKQGR